MTAKKVAAKKAAPKEPVEETPAVEAKITGPHPSDWASGSPNHPITEIVGE